MQAPSWKTVRTVALFFGGLLGLAHETIVIAEPRESLLVIFGAMMGLPAFLKQDEKKMEEEDVGKPPPIITDRDRDIAAALLQAVELAKQKAANAVQHVRDYRLTAGYTVMAGFAVLATVMR